MMKRIESWGVPVSPLLKRLESVADVLNHYRAIEAAGADMPYAIDGVVYQVDRLGWQARLGFCAKAPRWAPAPKTHAHTTGVWQGQAVARRWDLHGTRTHK